MTQEDKELLLKDLCSRLPYGVIIKHKDEHGKSIDTRLVGYNGDWFNYYIDDLCFHLKIHEFKPYLRPMSSMTEEECDMVEEILGNKCIFDFMSNGDIILKQGQFSQNKLAKLYDYYNLIHVDYHGLISKELALEAPEGMYK